MANRLLHCITQEHRHPAAQSQERLCDQPWNAIYLSLSNAQLGSGRSPLSYRTTYVPVWFDEVWPAELLSVVELLSPRRPALSFDSMEAAAKRRKISPEDRKKVKAGDGPHAAPLTKVSGSAKPSFLLGRRLPSSRSFCLALELTAWRALAKSTSKCLRIPWQISSIR